MSGSGGRARTSPRRACRRRSVPSRPPASTRCSRRAGSSRAREAVGQRCDTSNACRVPRQSPSIRTPSTTTGEPQVGPGSRTVQRTLPERRSTPSSPPAFVATYTMPRSRAGVDHEPPLPFAPAAGSGTDQTSGLPAPTRIELHQLAEVLRAPVEELELARDVQESLRGRRRRRRPCRRRSRNERRVSRSCRPSARRRMSQPCTSPAEFAKYAIPR